MKYMNDFSGFFDMTDSGIILISAAISLLLIEGLDTDQQRTLGNFLMCLGQNVISASDQSELHENRIGKIKDNYINNY